MEQPTKVAVVELVTVELIKLLSAALELVGKLANNGVLLRPVTVGEDFSLELNALDSVCVVLLLELVHQLD